jgi:large subunit ribosomal protein L31e
LGEKSKAPEEEAPPQTEPETAKTEPPKAPKAEGAGEAAVEEEPLAEEGEAAVEEEPLAEEGEAAARRRDQREEEAFLEEIIYTVPLRRAWIAPPKKRAPRAVRIIKAFVQRHMKVGEGAVEAEEEEERARIIISNEVNERIWRRGIEKPPRKLRIRAAKDEDGNVTVFLA